MVSISKRCIREGVRGRSDDNVITAKEVTSHRNVNSPARAGEMTLSLTAPLLLWPMRTITECSTVAASMMEEKRKFPSLCTQQARDKLEQTRPTLFRNRESTQSRQWYVSLHSSPFWWYMCIFRVETYYPVYRPTTLSARSLQVPQRSSKLIKL